MNQWENVLPTREQTPGSESGNHDNTWEDVLVYRKGDKQKSGGQQRELFSPEASGGEKDVEQTTTPKTSSPQVLDESTKNEKILKTEYYDPDEFYYAQLYEEN